MRKSRIASSTETESKSYEQQTITFNSIRLWISDYIHVHITMLIMNILYPHQHGFQSGHSTFMALLDIQYSILASMNFLLEFSSTWLSLWYGRSLHSIKMLENVGIRGLSLKWFNSYLDERQERVSCNGDLSKVKLLQCGVPQGSIFGPVPVLLDINYISNSSPLLHFILCHDDTSLINHSLSCHWLRTLR